MNKFIGREKELERLKSNAIVGPNLIVIRGRRRIGKSLLVQEYAKKIRILEFSGLAPTNTMNAQVQRDNFANQLIHQLKLSPFTFQD